MPRFVLLRHELPPGGDVASHWDLMLQQGDSLLTWRLESLPAGWTLADDSPGRTDNWQASIEVAAVRLADHRLTYLDYEGPISGDRGKVRRVDDGEYEAMDSSSGRYHVQLDGDVLKGGLLLEHVANEKWRLTVDAV
jgi:hypothetical protein